MGLSGIWSDRISKGGFNKNNKNTQQYFQVAFGFTLFAVSLCPRASSLP